MHKVREHDIVAATEPTWHGLEQMVEKITLENSGLNWSVNQEPLYAGGNIVPGFKALMREDNSHTLTVAKDSYAPIQNSEVFAAIDDALVGVDHEITCSGSLDNNNQTFISVRLSGEQRFVNNVDEFQMNLNFLNSFNGTVPFVVSDSHIRVVCGNTFSAAIRGRKRGKVNLSVRHTKNYPVQIQNLTEILEGMFEKRDEFFTSMEYLGNRPMNLERAEKLVAAFEGGPTAEKLSGVARRRVHTIAQLYENGLGNKGENTYDLFNGATEFYTRGQKPENFMQADVGDAAKTKTQVLDFLSLSDEDLRAQEQIGEALLKNSKELVLV